MEISATEALIYISPSVLGVYFAYTSIDTPKCDCGLEHDKIAGKI